MINNEMPTPCIAHCGGIFQKENSLFLQKVMLRRKNLADFSTTKPYTKPL